METQGVKAGVNMWALLDDDDPAGDRSPSLAVDQKASKPTAAELEPLASNGGNAAAKRGKKSKEKKVAGEKQAPPNGEVADDVHAPNGEEAQSSHGDGGQRMEEEKVRRHKEKNKVAAVPSKQAETRGGGGPKPDGGGAPAAGGSHCRVVARRICKAVVAVALLALYFQLASSLPVVGRAI